MIKILIMIWITTKIPMLIKSKFGITIFMPGLYETPVVGGHDSQLTTKFLPRVSGALRAGGGACMKHRLFVASCFPEFFCCCKTSQRTCFLIISSCGQINQPSGIIRAVCCQRMYRVFRGRFPLFRGREGLPLSENARLPHKPIPGKF